MLAPHVPRDALPTCVWERLERLCAVVYAPKQRKGMVWHAEWRRGVVCSMHPPPAGNGGDSMATTGDAAVAAGVVAVGTMKPTSTEAENAILLQPDCDGEGDGTRLVEPLPPPGESSLPMDALLGATGGASRNLLKEVKEGAASGGRMAAAGRVGGDAGADATRLGELLESGGTRMHGLRRKLETGRRVRILAIGASNTAMFAPACADDGCECATHEPLDEVAKRLSGLASRHGALGRGQPDWLVRLVLTLHKRYPSSPKLAVAQAYGGLDPKTVASCLADFLEGSRSFVAHDPLCATDAPEAAPPSCSDAVPDLLVLDFAIFAGKRPTLSYLVSLEKLLRFLHPKDTAVVFLNMANWCRGGEGVVAWEVMGHAKCQRMLFDPERSVSNLGRAPVPDEWHGKLAQLAGHYGHASVSTFHALMPLVVTGQLNASDFTQDGMHPIYWPRGTDLGHVYVSYIADALAFAIDPSAVSLHTRLWTGRRRQAPLSNLLSRRRHSASLWAQIASEQRRLVTGRASGKTAGDGEAVGRTGVGALPPPLSSEVDELRGVRCYGWAGRSVAHKGGNRGAWPKAVVSGVAWTGDGLNGSGWALTNVEVMYNGQRWVPLAKRSKKPGLTSVTPGDAFEVAVDTSLREEAQAAASAAKSSSGSVSEPSARHGEAASTALVPVLQVTYLESYEQVGVLRVTCVRACSCQPLRVDTLEPKRRFATLSTALSGPVTRSPRCVLRVMNESPQPAGNASRTKVKVVSLAVLSKQASAPARAGR